MHIAAMNGHEDIMRILLAHGAEVNATEMDGISVLHAATMARQLPIVKLLVEEYTVEGKVVNLELADKERNTPLMTAIDLNDLELVTYLRSKGAVYSDWKNIHGNSALDMAQKSGDQTEIIKILRLDECEQPADIGTDIDRSATA